MFDFLKSWFGKNSDVQLDGSGSTLHDGRYEVVQTSVDETGLWLSSSARAFAIGDYAVVAVPAGARHELLVTQSKIDSLAAAFRARGQLRITIHGNPRTGSVDAMDDDDFNDASSYGNSRSSSDFGTGVVVGSILSNGQKVEPPPSGGGTFAGAGASGSWDESTAAAVDAPQDRAATESLESLGFVSGAAVIAESVEAGAVQDDRAASAESESFDQALAEPDGSSDSNDDGGYGR